MAGFDSGGIILYSGDGGRVCFQLRPFLKGSGEISSLDDLKLFDGWWFRFVRKLLLSGFED
ncbi:hypothetical protein F2Q68_00037239 [Brassica cretica]|uniref:Uncharacterized protein n=1 Tax=Brassica cretica TaxID=69181 RepID=A0A8S9H550_BRACR|nr:hypothetical protein F2Q68_00037239 [Brassica cretica]